MSVVSFVNIENAVKLITLLKHPIPERFLSSFRCHQKGQPFIKVIQMSLFFQGHWIFTICIEYNCFGTYGFITMLAIYFMQNMSDCIRLATTTIPKYGRMYIEETIDIKFYRVINQTFTCPDGNR